MSKSKELFDRAKKVMPGGVNSPVRAFMSVNMDPNFIEKGVGNRIYDVDGKEYIDFIGSWGPMILGHVEERVMKALMERVGKGLSFGASTEIEVLMAEFITQRIPHVEMIRMVNSGTEAVMSALRLARGYTNRDKILKFEGCYHGHSDSMLVKAGSGAMTFGEPNSLGVPKKVAEDTLTAKYNDLDSVKKLFLENKDEIACVIVEPVAANMGVVPPKSGFLEGLRKICDENRALLIFDEVITGFRLSFGGAAEYFGITPDLVCYGKIIGGGMPVGAYGGKKEIMEMVSPIGKVYQAGTLSGNPIAMTLGLETLRILWDEKEIYKNINEMGSYLAEGLRKETGFTVNQEGSLVCLYYTKDEVYDFDTASKSDAKGFTFVFKNLMEKGIYIAPSQYEAMFINNSFSKEDLDYVINSYREIMKNGER